MLEVTFSTRDRRGEIVFARPDSSPEAFRMMKRKLEENPAIAGFHVFDTQTGSIEHFSPEKLANAADE